MIRLRDKRNGVIVQVNEDFAAQLSSAYEPVDETPEADKSTTKRTTRKSAE